MSQISWLARFWPTFQAQAAVAEPPLPLQRPALNLLADYPLWLPDRVRDCPVAQKYLHLLGALPWDQFPERPTDRAWPGSVPRPRAAFAAAFLVKIYEQKPYMPALRQYLVEHPALVWLLGFRLEPEPTSSWGFDVEASLPTAHHFGRVLRELDNHACQFLLDATVRLLAQALPADLNFGQTISLGTKAILAWIKENNPKAYLKEKDRLTKSRQPKGDPDCKLGCKKKPIAPRLPRRYSRRHPGLP